MIKITSTHVVSLTVDVERRRHISEHFGLLGLENYCFFDAVTAEHPDVRAAYQNGKVMKYPPCFRCGKMSCECFNNILIPQQVANWLSFRKLWQTLPEDKDQYFLICEDDVAFHTNAMPLLNEFLHSFEPQHDRVLIRMAQSGQEPHRTLDTEVLATRWGPVMSNAAYILNGALAAWLSRQPLWIAQTSDNWLHGEIAARGDIHAVTLDPLLATDLSYHEDYAKFVSRIHPKGINREDEKRAKKHVKRVDSVEVYQALLASWFDER